MKILQDIALLAPVPLEHLQTGKQVCLNEGKVAFGSNAFEIFRELDLNRSELRVHTYIYASHGSHILQVSWQAFYIGYVESIGGAHPDGMKYRPPSTLKYRNDNVGHWGGFWEVEELREIQPEDKLWISQLQSLASEKYFAKNFVPEGPILIQCP